MSRYTFAGKERRYRITVGFDNQGGSLFAQVEVVNARRSEQVLPSDMSTCPPT